MNKIELAEELRLQPRWAKFAGNLEREMREYPLDGVTIVIRRLTTEEMKNDSDRQVLRFNQGEQLFDFAVGPKESPPDAESLADQIDNFLNPQ